MRNGSVDIHKTEYIGIYRQSELTAAGRLWWITDDNDGEHYFGLHRPTDTDIMIYRNDYVAQS